ncbi:UNVERIFIED_CONTAM: hypothetical protein K2H54_061436 [Gekko kuhli]
MRRLPQHNALVPSKVRRFRMLAVDAISTSANGYDSSSQTRIRAMACREAAGYSGGTAVTDDSASMRKRPDEVMLCQELEADTSHGFSAAVWETMGSRCGARDGQGMETAGGDGVAKAGHCGEVLSPSHPLTPGVIKAVWFK